MLKSVSFQFFLTVFLLTAAVLFAGPSHAGDLAFGLGIESQLQREVNTSYSDFQTVGQFFAKFRQFPWALMVELAPFEHRISRSGGLTVDSRTAALGLWGRYEFFGPEQWSPFVSAGAGIYFDRVQTSFVGSNDDRKSKRGLLGVGGGLTTTIWERLLLEAEIRLASVQERQDPALSILLKAGAQF